MGKVLKAVTACTVRETCYELCSNRHGSAGGQDRLMDCEQCTNRTSVFGTDCLTYPSVETSRMSGQVGTREQLLETILILLSVKNQVVWKSYYL